MSAATAKTTPLNVPSQVPASALVGSKTASVFSPPAERMIQTASSRKIPISKAPRAIPALVERRMSR
jgi:hypothetical protein